MKKSIGGLIDNKTRKEVMFTDVSYDAFCRFLDSYFRSSGYDYDCMTKTIDLARTEIVFTVHDINKKYVYEYDEDRGIGFAVE